MKQTCWQLSTAEARK